MATTAEEEEFIRKRLLTHTSKANNVTSPLTKLTKRYLAFCSAAESGELKATEDLYQALLKEINVYELQVSRLAACHGANLREQQCHTSERDQLESTITQVQEEIEQLQDSLDTAREERNNKEEYEVLRRLCMQHPARAETREAIAAVQKDLEKLETESRKANSMLEERKKQFALLLHAASELQLELKYEAVVDEAEPEPMDI
mmetsp:Transcript_5439/g.7347  ORF Transcript_5439/g.7347 Transcript_5439/m.7347 type:complete len:203 (+) Transcript_5439:120-728(+)|eukprot:CAMPEP_0196588258 /NCGR_PEP_ID=MMETSP1081-20130531/60016_1 /TAXON_ID=36882 /ORGANISM="Pyramimonas amylifera, Strain CCMP720" /LENGTH=202 /DNA_ID=CAMNT_0041910707 /DNA_START=120 /DNA_END=728 /DNA_ORIENTATION=+